MKGIVGWVAFLTLIFVALVVGLEVAAINSESAQADKYRAMKDTISGIGGTGWSFVSPLLQLIIVLLILEWFAQRLGLGFKLSDIGGSANVQVLIAVFVIGSYCVAVLGGIRGADSLKEIALIVVGFYFGSRLAERQQRVAESVVLTPPHETPKA